MNRSLAKDRDRRIERSIAYLRRHYDKPMKVAHLAGKINFSSSHFIALFKRKTGYAPINFFIRLRMQRACHLLDNTALSIREIAAVLGYKDQFYFSRLFKSIYGAAPTDYRNKNRRATEMLLPTTTLRNAEPFEIARFNL